MKHSIKRRHCVCDQVIKVKKNKLVRDIQGTLVEEGGG